MKQLTEEQAHVLVQFLGEHWNAFGTCAEEQGLTQEEMDDLYIALGGEE